MTPPTASQTVGPFFHLGVCFLGRDRLAAPGVDGEVVTIQGKVIDGDGAGVCDALLEFWQADAAGQFAVDRSEQKRSFAGFGRVETDADGAFRFTTIKPGRIPFRDGSLQAPHIVVTVFARGLLKPLWTRIYFPGEAANAEDPVLKLVPRERQGTLIARSSGERGNGNQSENILDWDVVLQGDGETVFFEY